MRAALPHAWGLPIGQAEMLAMPRRSRSARALFCPASPWCSLLAQTLVALDVQSRELRPPLLSVSLPVFDRLSSLSSGSQIRPPCQTVPTISRPRSGGLTLCTQRREAATLTQVRHRGAQLLVSGG